ncbi:MAG: PHB depolymerase family esterase, partial [Hansschlegelia sp.]
RLTEIEDFGPNPGSLRMLAYAPAGLPKNAPLVVVLHGCTQTAEGYESHAGWTKLADAEGFAVLYPEQSRSNNSQGCFNWFLPADSARGLGESRSIRGMVDAATTRFGTDPARVYVTGLSAGGAMAAALLADYPEVFAAGAVIAGLPCGAATSVSEAFEAMSQPREKSARQLGDIVRARSTHTGPWPRIQIWHGSADRTVTPKNAEALARQWTDVHGIAYGSAQETPGAQSSRKVWTVDGRPLVELVSIPRMGHGTPLDGAQGERKGPFMLDVGISSTQEIAAFFGVTEGQVAAAAPHRADAPPQRAEAKREVVQKKVTKRLEPEPEAKSGALDVGAVISRALKAAGLMR